MIETIFLKICFSENELQDYLKEDIKTQTMIYAHYDEEKIETCFLISIEDW